jgi:hypothetical protein
MIWTRKGLVSKIHPLILKQSPTYRAHKQNLRTSADLLIRVLRSEKGY